MPAFLGGKVIKPKNPCYIKLANTWIILNSGGGPTPKVYLNPGSVSVAVDRLYKKGFVNRVECSKDRRVRTVSLTEKGRQIFATLFRRHTALIKRAFQDVSSEEREQLEVVLKKIGKRAESLAEKKGRSQLGQVGSEPI